MNYKTDDSFFTTVFPPFLYYGWSVKSWLLNDENAKFRYIRDYEIEQEFWNLEQIEDIYPDIKTITIVVNPWTRVYYSYQQLCIMKNNKDDRLLNLDQLPLDSFSKFVNALPAMPDELGNFWFSLTTPMCRWIDYEVDGELKTSDYVLRDISIEDDFQKIQEYFCSNIPLELPKKLPSYKNRYSKKTRDIVNNLFKEDIDRFGYEF